MGQNIEQQTRKALAYVICLDLVKGALSNIGSVNSADGSKTASIVFDEVSKAAETQKQ